MSVKDKQPSAQKVSKREPTVHAVRHAVELLRCIAQAQPEITISEVARRIGLHKSSVSRLIATLVAEHILERSPQTDGVRLGFGLVALAAPLLSGTGLPQAARARIATLAERSGETVNLSIWDGGQAVSVFQALGTNAITHYAAPGQSNPAHCTASGKLLLAFASDVEIERILAEPLTRYTEHTCTDPAILASELPRIRTEGRAINRGEFASDVGAVAALVRDMDGRARAAVTITVPMYRFSPERETDLLALVEVTASDISAQLGYQRGQGNAAFPNGLLQRGP
ncbi:MULTISPECIES: IclR family transcriptional regulator [unclassified Chelatococcus]|uniref:IclR family transcriptional regulator n=1 Tax=unclassified Chelatococcus TaxID=2638111 RepID=UPI001BCCBDBE|nr:MULTISPECIES: IclR family transcriptional regulator [unclassified Chelatococcus]CAH1658302.1 IclR family transcriptional regulator [Hyphomicrobiales bacterium]MBS7742190.1 IclR family transcriptional regulator [Chelatococcus sp. HY11]MBX3542692.1 IclR family transcriptional regulator [Chelatococcus sp.]MCO5075092.1 IclR family transcriptional regulator [Chelatococcus sp.]CAH1689725.1 IclR family transcriptional regulator [Hyphomicrobiales bacterium]